MADALVLLAALSEGWQPVAFWLVLGTMCGMGVYLSAARWWYVGFLEDPDPDLGGDVWACGMGHVEE